MGSNEVDGGQRVLRVGLSWRYACWLIETCRVVGCVSLKVSRQNVVELKVAT